jgi:hypothetical protein
LYALPFCPYRTCIPDTSCPLSVGWVS